VIGRAALALTGAAWLYEAVAILTRRWPTITEHTHRQRHRAPVVVAVYAGLGWLYHHLMLED
jgi:hypothetical protein